MATPQALDTNPYAPPRFPAAPPSTEPREVSRWWRLAGFAIDAGVIVIIDGLALAMTPLTAAHLQRASYEIFAIAHFIAFVALYYMTLETLFQRTLGKALLGMRVTARDGAKPKARQIALRTLARLIPFEQLSFLGAGLGFHDASSGTRVQRRR